MAGCDEMTRRTFTGRLAAVGLSAATFNALSPHRVVAQNDDGSPTPPSGVERYTLRGEDIFPEGIAFRESTGDFFVSSTTDGTIYRGNIEDSGDAEVFLPGGQDGRTSAVGMTVDEQGRLFIAGRRTGQVFIYDADDGRFIQSFSNERENTLVNDAVAAPDGDVYITDSFSAVLYRVSENDEGVFAFEVFIDFDSTPIQYRNGFNLNGIVVTADGSFLIAVQTNSGNLFRIDSESREILRIDLGNATLTTGDGLVLDGQTLYAVRNEPGDVVPVELSEGFDSGIVGEGFGSDSLQYPTTAAMYGDRLLVVNSQFNRQGGQPQLPFTVSSIPIPG